MEEETKYEHGDNAGMRNYVLFSRKGVNAVNREQLLDEWKEIEKKERKLKEDTEDLRKRKEKFRLAEVDYVLENVRAFAREGKIGERYIDMYLCHCQNMLSGNIDGTVLSFNEKNVESEG